MKRHARLVATACVIPAFVVAFGLAASTPPEVGNKNIATALRTEAATASSPSFTNLVRSSSSLSDAEMQQFMQDEHYAVRCLGALAAGFHGRAGLAPDIVRLLLDPVSEVQLRALTALGWLGDPAYAADVVSFVDSNDPRIAAVAYDVLIFWIGVDTFIPVSRQKIVQGDARAKDLLLFGAFAEPDDLSVLSRFLVAGTDEDLRTATIQAVQRRFSIEPFGTLEEQAEECRLFIAPAR